MMKCIVYAVTALVFTGCASIPSGKSPSPREAAERQLQERKAADRATKAQTTASPAAVQAPTVTQSAPVAAAAPVQCQKNLRINIWDRAAGKYVDLSKGTANSWRGYRQAPRATKPHPAQVMVEQGGQSRTVWSGVVQGGIHVLPLPPVGPGAVIRTKVQGVLPQYSDHTITYGQMSRIECDDVYNANMVE